MRISKYAIIMAAIMTTGILAGCENQTVISAEQNEEVIDVEIQSEDEKDGIVDEQKKTEDENEPAKSDLDILDYGTEDNPIVLVFNDDSFAAELPSEVFKYTYVALNDSINVGDYMYFIVDFKDVTDVGGVSVYEDAKVERYEVKDSTKECAEVHKTIIENWYGGFETIESVTGDPVAYCGDDGAWMEKNLAGQGGLSTVKYKERLEIFEQYGDTNVNDLAGTGFLTVDYNKQSKADLYFFYITDCWKKSKESSIEEVYEQYGNMTVAEYLGTSSVYDYFWPNGNEDDDDYEYYLDANNRLGYIYENSKNYDPEAAAEFQEFLTQWNALAGR